MVIDFFVYKHPVSPNDRDLTHQKPLPKKSQLDQQTFDMQDHALGTTQNNHPTI